MRQQFKIIDHKSGYKADFIILKTEPYRITEFERRRLIDFSDMKIYVVSPEDLLLSGNIKSQRAAEKRTAGVTIFTNKACAILKGGLNFGICRNQAWRIPVLLTESQN